MYLNFIWIQSFAPAHSISIFVILFSLFFAARVRLFYFVELGECVCTVLNDPKYNWNDERFAFEIEINYSFIAVVVIVDIVVMCVFLYACVHTLELIRGCMRMCVCLWIASAIRCAFVVEQKKKRSKTSKWLSFLCCLTEQFTC